MSKYENEIEEAIAAASLDKVPEEFKETTYEVILQHEINGNLISSSISSKVDVSNIERETLKDWEEQLAKELPKGSVAAEGTRSQQTVWAVVTLYLRGKEANRDSIRKVIKDELGVTPQSEDNTSRTLKNLVPEHLNRSKEGKIYYYEPIRNAVKIFNN